MSEIRKAQTGVVVPRYELFEHFADIGVRGIGRTLAEAFEQGALALTFVITDPGSVNLDSEVTVKCEAPDPELLFVDWLNAIIYEMATRHMIFGKYSVEITGNSLVGRAIGETVDKERHQPAVEIKAATFTQLKVYQNEHGFWVAQCVVDV
jgi:SHS2 domain-containing protein